MIRGIGIDMAEIKRFTASYARFGMRFPERILADSELRDFARAHDPGRFLPRKRPRKPWAPAFAKASPHVRCMLYIPPAASPIWR
jgi:holo-[acyl-carrier protein] synthase